jgi:hypothetical protein
MIVHSYFGLGAKRTYNFFFRTFSPPYFTVHSTAAIRRPPTWPAVAVVVRSRGWDAPVAERA